MKSITKHFFLRSRECLTRGWFLRRPDQFPEPPPSLGLQFRFDQGTEVGELARQLFPGGVLAPGGSNLEAAETTRQLMNDPKVEVMFEGTFIAGDYVTRPDVLIRGDAGWHVIEVKSKVEPNSAKMRELRDDLTYTVMVLRQAGLNVLTASIMVMARNYRKGFSIDQLLVKVDHTDIVNARMNVFLQDWDRIAQATGADDRPQPRLCAYCGDCPHFATNCIGRDVQYPVTTLNNIRAPALAALANANVMSIRDIPADFALSELPRRIADCVRNDRKFVSPALSETLRTVEWPALYLDFETVDTALPLIENVAPWEKVPTQFSIHRCTAPGQIESHVEYLADPSRDCRRELAEQLLAALGERGSIVAYATLERTQIQSLARAVPELAESLLALLPRLIDLCAVIRQGYYDPRFAGSFSLKTVLPVLVPDLNYDDLAIAEGGTASMHFAKMARGETSPQEVQQLRQRLLDYCRRDTLAMVRLHEVLTAELRLPPMR